MLSKSRHKWIITARFGDQVVGEYAYIHTDGTIFRGGFTSSKRYSSLLRPATYIDLDEFNAFGVY